ncbi:sulfurtransferase [Halanaerobium sp. ST460_2HS_T2]|jgi:thiosulfate/3-mercaptopyruvate sulfurtransferase|uniref:sulfurtransferase n=1 Tax=Halanaerobium sp. ST460_2HS_T2 TaxID=2183914 RepID=UPI000DF24FD7|nr:sulfurtransferase [Halanaerobium sp. ST460_2HS_T2]RCW56539.1 thiosulfate/3-mercaptopyruvate sulfurtransferase [Halanaerobium sp. ST460_2HS_T2]
MNNDKILILIFISIIIISTSLSFSAVAAEERGFENPDLLISASELNKRLKNENNKLKIIDVRNSARYLLGHLPGAVNMWGSDFSDPEGWVEGLIADPKAFSVTVQKKGINNDSKIIVYDENNSVWAARLWWVFRVYGHQNIKVLEGGYDNWKDNDFETNILPNYPDKGNFLVQDVINEWIVNSDTIAENLDNEKFIVLDTRTEAEYLGQKTGSSAPRKGRIPNSIHLEWNRVLTENYNFKSASEIKQIYQEKGITKDKEVIALISHTGVRAAHSFFALKLLGYDNLKLFDESWLGWSNRSDLPIELK